MLIQARVWAGLMTTLLAGTAWAADHREAPRISEFPPADLNDIYAFQATGNPNRLVLVMTVNPLSEPEFAGTYAFSPDVVYAFVIDTDSDGAIDHRIPIRFSELEGGAQTFTVNLPDGITLEGQATRPTVLSDEPNEPIIVSGQGVQAFAGPRDDPFFFDGVGFARFVNGAGTFSGDDSFADLNVSAIVLEFPFALLDDDGDGLIEIAGVTTRRNRDGFPADDQRLDRTGNPAVSTVLIPVDQRDDFNRGLSRDDARDYADVIVASLENLGTSSDNIAILALVAVPDTLKFDIDEPALFPNGRALEDDVIDTLLSLVLNGPASDGVDANDKTFLLSFPYLAPPFQAD